MDKIPISGNRPLLNFNGIRPIPEFILLNPSGLAVFPRGLGILPVVTTCRGADYASKRVLKLQTPGNPTRKRGKRKPDVRRF